MCWDGNRNRAVVLTLHELTRELERSMEEARAAQIQMDFVLTAGDCSLLLTVGEGDRSFVAFMRGPVEQGNALFDYVLDGQEEDPAHPFLYGGSYSEVDFNRTVPSGDAIKAVREFFETGEKPGWLPWEAV
ncbi:Imm1 family immunity protein [Deinococcus aerius]|uniref:Imm1 family immunity protein n=1 Tax=Deinococcus aerius TaxID=200253 RepID=UPI000CCC0756